MSTKIYLIRHGESEANRHGLFLGHGDLDLTENGRKQAFAAAEYLRNIKADAICSSDLKRAYNTAEYTAEIQDLPIIKDVNLREINAGLWEKVPFTEIAKRYKDDYSVWLDNIGRARCSGGESVEELSNRIVSEVRYLAEKSTGGVIFIFTHATPIRTLAAHCLGRSLNEVKAIPWAANASVTSVEYDNGMLRLIDYGYDGFMGGISTSLPSNV